MKRVLSIVAMICVLIGLHSCRTTKVVPLAHKEIVRERLIPVSIPGDSTEIKVVFDCDENGKVQVIPVSTRASPHALASMDRVGSMLTIKTEVSSRDVWIPYREVERQKEIPVQVEVEKVVYKLNTFQRIFFWIGVVCSALAIIVLVFKLL